MRPGRRRGRPLAGGGGSLGGMSRPFALKEEEEEELGFVLPRSARDWNRRRRRKGQRCGIRQFLRFPPCLEMLDKRWNSAWLLNSSKRKCRLQNGARREEKLNVAVAGGIIRTYKNKGKKVCRYCTGRGNRCCTPLLQANLYPKGADGEKEEEGGG